MSKIVFFGIDVDDKSFHITGITESEFVRSQCRPSAAALATKLKEIALQLRADEIKACYEAGYLGFSLYHELRALDIPVEVIAPSSIPRAPDHQIKTDRIDSDNLAKYYRVGHLTIVRPPDKEDEVVRDLCRSRQFIMQQRNAARLHCVAICRRQGWSFKQDTGLKTHWTFAHYEWLKKRRAHATNRQLQFNLDQLTILLESLDAQIKHYTDEIALIAEENKYRANVEALICYRGIDTLTAMVLVTELGDITRFSNPRSLMSYIGLDVREYSSGGKQTQYGITKLGNKHLRRALVEGVQSCYKRPKVSYTLKRRREKSDPEFSVVANKCMNRLYKKSTRMLMAGKNVNKVKIACARELIGFIWSSLNQVNIKRSLREDNKRVSNDISASK